MSFLDSASVLRSKELAQTLKSTSRLILAVLADMADDQGHCWPSRAEIMERVGCSPRTLQDSLKTLRTLGLIETKQSQRGSALFTLHIQRLPGKKQTAMLPVTAPYDESHQPADWETDDVDPDLDEAITLVTQPAAPIPDIAPENPQDARTAPVKAAPVVKEAERLSASVNAVFDPLPPVQTPPAPTVGRTQSMQQTPQPAPRPSQPAPISTPPQTSQIAPQQPASHMLFASRPDEPTSSKTAPEPEKLTFREAFRIVWDITSHVSTQIDAHHTMTIAQQIQHLKKRGVSQKKIEDVAASWPADIDVYSIEQQLDEMLYEHAASAQQPANL